MNVKYILTLADAQRKGLTAGFVSTAVDLDTRKIVGYVEGHGFDDQALKAKDVLKLYEIILVLEDGGWSAPLAVMAKDVACAFAALGAGNRYQETWGDFRGLLEAAEGGCGNLRVYEVTHLPIARDSLQISYQIAKAQGSKEDENP
jgi:hypothetical protein